MRISFLLSASLTILGLVQDGLAIPTSPPVHSLDGQGVYVESDKVSRPYKFPRVRKCWHDYFAVEASKWKRPWVKSSGNIYCTDTQWCGAAYLNGTQVCQSRTETVSASMGLKIDATVAKGLVPGVCAGVEFSFSIEESECYSAS
ncbi:hypothetical protein AJ79_00846 [Helicocarpus griseus UAMH5409]|uniref:Uncharacterized protein n=1 Tax=Helicocarpus griseus UAMH5409 TaxID=1447875 RepID=A0A2B7YBG8_9EURO|nr:hypothetical protein AJ79_00846 [Helicocarpus griseus UAMH5409]